MTLTLFVERVTVGDSPSIWARFQDEKEILVQEMPNFSLRIRNINKMGIQIDVFSHHIFFFRKQNFDQQPTLTSILQEPWKSYINTIIMPDGNSHAQNTTMKSLAISDYCKPDKYAMMTLPVPKVDEPDQLLIKVHAASINPVDVQVASGMVKAFWPQP
jgi:hypothetical protein